jgi:nucleotide-binding universal stress UspA family protein
MTQTLIVVTTDFSAESERAFAPAAELARRLGARIALLHVVEVAAIAPHGAPLAPVQTPPDLPTQLNEAERRLAKSAGKFAKGVPVTSVALSSTDPVRTITEYAANEGAAFIALSTHGRRGLRRLILGSTAEAIVRHATVPVICYPRA